MAECLQKPVELVDKMKKDNEKRIKHLEEEIIKIRVTMNSIMKKSHKIVKNYATTMKIMVEKLENTQQGTLIVDLEADKDKSQKDDSIPS